MRVTLRTYDQQETTLLRGDTDPSKDGEIPCFQCGVCCIKWQPLMDEAETERIATAMGMSGPGFRRQYTREYPPRPGWYMMLTGSLGCTFLQFDGPRAICSIHEFKPQVCRDWTSNLSKPECQEGLARMATGPISTPGELYASEVELKSFIKVVEG